jgi:CubicO group peptidase (beta-lactamase class C family)
MDSTFWDTCEAAAERWDVPALAIGGLLDARLERRSFGCDVDARFRIASVTKPFTAAAAVRALPLEEAVRTWSGVSIGDLLAHMSGHDAELGSPAGYAGYGDDEYALERLARELPACRRWLPGGELWSYSNAGYWLAGWLLAERSGRTYEDVIAELAAEAGLAATDFGEPDLAGTGPAVMPGPYPRARRPSGGLVSTVDDLLQFGAWMLRQPDLDQMRVVRGKPVAGVYGLGLFGERVGVTDVWGHPGSYGGFESSFVVVPSRNAVLVGLTNSSRGSRALREIEDAWFDDLLGARRRVAPTIKLSPTALRAFAGDYANSTARVSVRVVGPDLLVIFEGADAAVARAIGPRTFEVTEGLDSGSRFDFPRAGLARFGGRLAGLFAD